MKTRAAVLHKINTPFSIETLELSPPQTGEVLVKVTAAGVCHSDWHLVTGDTEHPLPVVPGHEGSGIIEAVGQGVTRVKPGDRVILNWAPNCGTCFYCLNDRPNLCSTYNHAIWAGVMMDGTPRLSLNGKPVYHFAALACFAEYAVVPQECCIPMEADFPLDVAALIGCAVTTGVGAVLNTARVRPGSNVVVFGAGGVGLNIIMAAKLAGASRIITVDLAEAKLHMALEFGATHTLMADSNTNEAIRQLTQNRGADYAFEAIGLPAVQEQCLDAIRPGGMAVLVGVSPMGSGTNLPGAIITRQEKTVTGSYYGTASPARDFKVYSDLFMQGKLDLKRLITQTYTLDEINQAYADMLSGTQARGVILFE
jgi:S-(hydroxymethyl)glutathione dehydrogenase/alcohol dehydrogenase